MLQTPQSRQARLRTVPAHTAPKTGVGTFLDGEWRLFCHGCLRAVGPMPVVVAARDAIRRNTTPRRPPMPETYVHQVRLPELVVHVPDTYTTNTTTARWE